LPSFAYRAVDRDGRRVRGAQESAAPAALTLELERRGLVVLHVEERVASAAPARRGGATRLAVLEVTRALAALLPAGMPLAKALAAAGNVAGGPVGIVLANVRERVERGDALHTALAAHPGTFPPLYVGLVRAGERSGTLAASFGRLGAQLEREEQLRTRLVSAAIYPLLLAVVGLIAVMVLLLFVLPRFAELLTGAGAHLPRSTALLLALADASRRWWPTLLVLPIGAALAAAWVRATEEGKRAWSATLLALPVLGTFRRTMLGARVARLAGTLLGGGAPLFAALGDTAESVADPIARDEIERVRARVREGVTLNRAIGEGTLFPTLLAQLVAVGEEAGRLEEFLVKAADILEERSERLTTRLVALLEPAMIVGFGGVVGFVALSLLQAIYGINAASFR
jgi:type II secretory pathway component PulF